MSLSQDQPNFEDDLLFSLTRRVFTDVHQLKKHLTEHHAGEVFVFTNGCFDILHKGHISYLTRARRLGDYLVVGVNSDSSVHALKGEGRPINHDRDRSLLLAALRCVDYAVIFHETTPIETIKILQPSIHTKGGDYQLETLPERSFVEEGGGRIVLLPFEEGYSTTSILNRL